MLVIYILGRSRKKRNHSFVDELEDDLPDFSAGSLDHVDEGVGRVRVISRGGDEADEGDSGDSIGISARKEASIYDNVYDEYGRIQDVNPEAADHAVNEAADADTANVESVQDSTSSTSTDTQAEDAGKKSTAPNMSDIVVVYILPKINEKLRGAQINSAAQAMGLSFGDMNIYHFRRGGRNIFSMANMLEPGSFDPDTIHDLTTSGLTIFMQLHEENPMDDLTELLQRSYQLAGLLGARLCNSKRKPLTEQDAENYREKVRRFIESKNFELSMET